ncbi:hypothetical protein E4U42_004465 [Claviceps africana]|uniref:Uncharacterized protein n=1 Tax=Claviceps africana TaxID=83212 RepID=A0A8K0J7Z2_9HYPO|nr:hypothetical protein E4U42_004465 [Claviceps africana]
MSNLALKEKRAFLLPRTGSIAPPRASQLWRACSDAGCEDVRICWGLTKHVKLELELELEIKLQFCVGRRLRSERIQERHDAHMLSLRLTAESRVQTAELAGSDDHLESTSTLERRHQTA